MDDIADLLDPELQEGYRAVAPLGDITADPARARELARAAAVRLPELEGIVRRDAVAPGPHDNPFGVPVRIYAPVERDGLLPAVVFLHGGGFVLGDDLSQWDGLCDRLAANVGAVVVSVLYRLAPEDPFPAPLEDCYAALRWTHASAAELRVDDTRIAVMGISAGGGLAAGVGLLARDRGEVSVAFQMPLCACLDDRHVTRSSREMTDPRQWSRDTSLAAWQAYLGPSHGGEVSPYAAPARADTLAGLPPTYLAVGQYDLMLDENLEWATRLLAEGVPTELHVYPGGFHGFEARVPQARISRDAVSHREQALRRALHPPS